MVAADSSSSPPAASPRHPQQEQDKVVADDGRTPLAVSDKSNGGVVRKSKNREITSRYKATTNASTPSWASATPVAPPVSEATSARRHPSPVLGRSSASVPSTESALSKRALSAERRRPWPAVTSESKNVNSPVDAIWPSSKTRLSGGRGTELLWPSSQAKQVEGSTSSASWSAEARSEAGDEARSPSSVPSPTSSVGSDQTLKPTSNGFHRPADSRGAPQPRKGSPMRRQSIDQTENSRPADYLRTKPDLQRWPGTSNGKVFGAAMTRSMDLSVEREKPANSRASAVAQSRPATSSGTRGVRPATSSLIPTSRNFYRSINEGPTVPLAHSSTRSTTPERRARTRAAPESTPKSVPQDASNLQIENLPVREILTVRQSNQETVLASADSLPVSVDNASDNESVSSGGSGNASRASSRGTTVPSRVWLDANNRARRLSEGDRVRASLSEQDLSAMAVAGGKAGRRTKVASLGTSAGTTPALVQSAASSAWSLSMNRAIPTISTNPQPPMSPVRGRSGSSPLRGLPSPTRTRPSLSTSGIVNRSNAVSSISFGTDMRGKGKKSISQHEENLILRILHNRWLQWRFVNARADAAMNAQKIAAERSIYNVWLRTSDLRNSVAAQRIKLQQAKHAQKLNEILSSQASQLQSWASLRQDHSSALVGIVEALEASILRVPVTGGARADVQAVREALGSAVDVMNAVELSVKSLLPKAESMDLPLAQLAKTAAQERALLDECGDLLSLAASLEIEERSLTTHFVQLENEKNRLLAASTNCSLAASESFKNISL